jgi:hypothetical protein
MIGFCLFIGFVVGFAFGCAALCGAVYLGGKLPSLVENDAQKPQETETRRAESTELTRLQKRLDEINAYRGDAL